MNRDMAAEGRRYVLIGFGRLGSSDPWLGLPVRWDQISAAPASSWRLPCPTPQAEPSQGSHFFHNLMSFGSPTSRSATPGPTPSTGRGSRRSPPRPRRTSSGESGSLALRVEVDGRSGREGDPPPAIDAPKGDVS